MKSFKSFKYKFNLSFSSEETVFNPSTSHVSKKVSKSFKNKTKRNGDKFSPCLTPLLHGKNSDIEFLYTIRDFVSLYIFTITLNIFPFILLSSNLCQSPSRQTVSNAFAKSTSAQCNFFFLFFKILKREWRINKLSKVEYPFRNPLWFSHSTRNSSEYCVSLSLKIEVNTLPKQLKTVIGLKFWGHLHDP